MNELILKEIRVEDNKIEYICEIHGKIATYFTENVRQAAPRSHLPAAR